MSNRADYPRTNRKSEGDIRIGDCHVWAEIYYLDSRTDYREYLPQPCAQRRAVAGDLVMLESSEFSQRSRARHLPLWPVVPLCVLIFWFLVRFVDIW
jgi:hypothetical protein